MCPCETKKPNRQRSGPETVKPELHDILDGGRESLARVRSLGGSETDCVRKMTGEQLCP